MSTGKLQINTYNETVALPLSDIKIQISLSSNPDKIISETITNNSGKSDILELEAPPVEYSLTPNSSSRPYEEYNIKISQPGFENINIEHVQILPDSVAEQNIYFKKIQDNNQTNLNYFIPEHTLYGTYPAKISEDSVKKLPEPSGLVVLDKVVIPEFIVVHDGDPNDDSAPNYWIYYQDYIKNVASSEIYATWPEESIKANILTIISFTLNRVYTEWYRNQNKNFTITSSTAYDQKFVYQRNIFQNISNIVDDIFTNFITKPDIKQPLFTQYCDGKNVTCPGWLSQWGSKELAESGTDYINILRTYYGSEIYLDNATQVTGIPSSYPGEILQLNSTGDSVKTIQRQLNSISNNYPAINKLSVDGIYGQNTVDSVKTFQNIFDLPETGITDYKTWYKISRIYTAVMRFSS